MSSIIEKELTCSICTDLLYDPVTFLDCLHTNCGACAKSWFTSLSNNAASSPGAPPKYTCPVCRSEVRATRHNSTLQSLIEDFIAKNPSKDRTPDEKAAIRKLYIPGGGVLPGEASRPVPVAPSLPRRRSSARPSTSRPSTSSRTDQTSLADLTRSFQSVMTLNATTCFHCQRRVDYAMCCQCLQCDITTCIPCFRLDKGCRTPSTAHIRVMRKLQLQPTRHVQTGVFCDICETWCDNSRADGGMNSYFWVCMECNTDSWEVCIACVSKGNCCSHELQLYTNERASARHQSIKGPTPVDLLSRLGAMTGSTDRNSLLGALGYVRWTNFNVTCDSCRERIPPDHSYLHCPTCSEGQWDICMECWTRSAAPDIFEEDDSAGFECVAGHKMLLLSQNGKEGTHKLILDVPHEPPDWVARTPVSGRRDGWNGVARDAVALKSHWPDPQNARDAAVYRGERPGVRPWDVGGLLAFPEGAAISDVWVAFTEGEEDELVEYLWGWYAGIGGLFPRDCVRFTD